MIVFATVLFTLLASLLLWSVVWGRGNWITKSVYIPLVMCFGLVIGYTLPDLLGWPCNADLPKEFEIKWVIVKEPNKLTGHEGEILLWTVSKNKRSFLSIYEPEPREPRVHRMDYSRLMHEELQQALSMLKDGKRVFGKSEAGKGNGYGKEGKGRKGKGKGSKSKGKGKNNDGGDQGHEPGILFKIYEMPEPVLPQKNMGL